MPILKIKIFFTENLTHKKLENEDEITITTVNN